MAKSTKKTKTRRKRTNTVTKKVGKTKKSVRKSGKKLFKPKKGKEMIKGLVSIAVNAGLQKGMNAAFEGRIKENDFKKDGVLDEKAYKSKLEQQKTIHGAANIGLWLMGAGNALPKEYVSTEYLEINALEHGISTFLGKSKKESIKKVAPYFQGIESGENFDIQGIESDDEMIAMIESAGLIEAAVEEVEGEEAYIQNNDIEYLESVESNKDDVEIEYEFEGIEGMNTVIPGIEEEN